MTQLYLKLFNHINDINGVGNLWGLQSKLNAYQNDKKGSHIINGLWYDLNDYYKKASGHDINVNEWTSNLKYLYLFNGTSSSYTLPIAYLSVFDTQEQADNYDVNNAHYSLFKLIDNTISENADYGQWVNLTSSGNGYDLKLGDNKTYYLRIDIGNPLSPVYNYPFVDYQHQPFNCYKDNTKPHIYDEINDVTCTAISSLTGIAYVGKSTTDVSFDINLSGKTSVMKFNTSNKDYKTNLLNYNEYFIISPHDSSKPTQVFYTLPKIAHVSFNPNNIELGKKTTVNVSIDSGYTVNKMTFWSNDENDGNRIFTATYKDGKIEFDLTYYDNSDLNLLTNNIKNSIDIKQVQTYAEINSTLYGANLNLSRLPVGKSSTLTITADDNHVLSVYSKNENFADAFYKIGENGQPQYRFMFDDNTHKSASCLITPSDTSVITVSCVTKWSNQPETQRKQVPIKLTLTNCNSNTSSLPENTDEEFENGHVIEKTITLTADDGYIFDKDVIYYFYDFNTASYTKDTVKATNKNTISFTMHAGAFDDLKYQAQKPEIIATANPEKEDVSTGLDSIHIYHMRNAELDNLSNKLISYFKTTSSGDTELQDYDYTRFINQVYRLPFSIPSSIEVDTTKVSAGLFNLNMNTKTIKVDHYDIDIGTIKIDSKDATSYNAIKATLYLPFISSVQLDINDIIGHTISITYRINLLNGINTLIVENENGLIYNQNVNVATNLQLFGAYYDKNVGSLNSVLNNNLRQAYIVIERKTPITNLLTYPTNEHGLISDYKGLTKFVNTQLHIDATFQEKQEILAQLEQGVNIK